MYGHFFPKTLCSSHCCSIFTAEKKARFREGKWFAQRYLWATVLYNDIVPSHTKHNSSVVQVRVRVSLTVPYSFDWQSVLWIWVHRECGYSEVTSPWKTKKKKIMPHWKWTEWTNPPGKGLILNTQKHETKSKLLSCIKRPPHCAITVK